MNASRGRDGLAHHTNEDFLPLDQRTSTSERGLERKICAALPTTASKKRHLSRHPVVGKRVIRSRLFLKN